MTHPATVEADQAMAIAGALVELLQISGAMPEAVALAQALDDRLCDLVARLPGDLRCGAQA